MIVCKLIGGLGNQLFQYAYTETLSKQLNEDFCFDISFYGNELPAIFRLNIANRKVADESALCDYKCAELQQKIYHVLQKVIRTINHEKIGERIFQCYSWNGYCFNFDPFYYSSINSKYRGGGYRNKYVYGYFQSEKYFKAEEKMLREQFSTDVGKDALSYENKIRETNAVAFHIRLGDYQKKKNKYLNVCTDFYYENAVRYICEHVQNPQFFVFTNDIEQAGKKYFIPDNAVFVTGTCDYEDLMLMKKCKHFIISNSTFSWWGSYLSENEKKIVVAPDIWMSTSKDEPDIYFDEMVRIKTFLKE